MYNYFEKKFEILNNTDIEIFLQNKHHNIYNSNSFIYNLDNLTTTETLLKKIYNIEEDLTISKFFYLLQKIIKNPYDFLFKENTLEFSSQYRTGDILKILKSNHNFLLYNNIILNKQKQNIFIFENNFEGINSLNKHLLNYFLHNNLKIEKQYISIENKNKNVKTTEIEDYQIFLKLLQNKYHIHFKDDKKGIQYIKHFPNIPISLNSLLSKQIDENTLNDIKNLSLKFFKELTNDFYIIDIRDKNKSKTITNTKEEGLKFIEEISINTIKKFLKNFNKPKTILNSDINFF